MEKKSIAILITLVLLFQSISFVKAEEGASLYLSPKSGTFFVGDVFDISVFLNTEGNSINTVQVDLKFPSDLLQITSPTAGKSFISVWVDQPFYSNKEGLIGFKGGVPSPGINTSAGLVSTIKFRAKTPGVASIYFLDSSKVLLSDGKGTDILKITSIGEYNLTILPPEGPKVLSSTHLSLTSWHRDNNPDFYWEKEEGVTDFSYILSQNPQEIPDNVSEGSSDSVIFNDISDGIWYFHVKAKKGDSWGGTTHYPVRIDSNPPEKFTISIEKIKQIGNHKFLAYFSTDDLFSGIDHYEISMTDISNSQANNNPFFIEAISPYQISFESAGKYNILIKAYDKAGNFKESKALLTIVNPLISYTREKAKIGGLSLSWWMIYLLIGILLVLLGFFIYRFLIRKNLAKRLKKEVAEAEKEIEDVKDLEKKIHDMRILEEEAKKESARLARRLKGEEKGSKEK